MFPQPQWLRPVLPFRPELLRRMLPGPEVQQPPAAKTILFSLEHPPKLYSLSHYPNLDISQSRNGLQRRCRCSATPGPGCLPGKGAKKLRQSHQTAAAVFLHAKLPSCPKHRKQMGDIHLSRSPDWRINSTCTSLLSFPMTDFRPVQAPPRLQWRYRSGFTPDSLFSAGTNQVHRRHLNVYFLFSQQNTIFPALCQGNFWKLP